MNDFKAEIERVEQAFEDGDFDLLRELLPPLVEKNIPAAIRINSSFFKPGTPQEDCDRLYAEGMFRAAELGDIKAKYRVGIFYDTGDCNITKDTVKASYIFKELAEKGDPHCLWIYACELIWGRGTFPKSTDEGIRLLLKAAQIGSASACITLAGFHDKGMFGFEKSIENRDEYRVQALKYDDSTHDPYA